MPQTQTAVPTTLFGVVLNLPDGTQVILDYRNFSFEPMDVLERYHICTPYEWLRTFEHKRPAIYTAYGKFVREFITRIMYPQHAFGKCFQRYKTDRTDPSRIFFYIRHNTIPVDLFDLTGYYKCRIERSGGMYSSSSSQVHICDGGFGRHSGYGFGGAHYYEYVIGLDALRALCLFFGIQQPRYLKGVEMTKTDSEILVDLTRSCDVGTEHPKAVMFSSN